MTREGTWRALRLAVRRGERLQTAAACWCLLAAMAGHALMETARDALFLGSLPAHRLPWVYLFIAAFALVLVAVHDRTAGRRFAPWHGLSVILLGSALGTLLLAGVISGQQRWSLYVLYTWSGVVASLLLVSFWTHADGLFTIRQARRLLPVIALAGIAGAVVGSAFARVLADAAGARALVPAAAACFAAAALGPLAARGPSRPRSEPRAPGAGWRLLVSDAHLRLVACVVVAATLALTFVDYLFKSTAARAVAPQDLASFFASTYLLVNGLSLVAQAGLSRRVLSLIGPSWTLALLPALLLVGSGAVAAGAVLAGSILSKAADGALRHSLHRTALEVVQVPVADSLRRSTKAILDVAGHRLSQAAASLALLALGAHSLRPGVMASVVAATSAAWILAVAALDRSYLALLRDGLRPTMPRGRRAVRPPAAPSAREPRELVAQLGRRSTREAARLGLRAAGDAGFAALTAALADEATPQPVRRHVPRTLQRFDPARAASVLLELLPTERDGVVRYKALRALGALRSEDPGLALPAARLRRLLEGEIERALALVGWRVALLRCLRGTPQAADPACGLLVELTRSEEQNTVERIFRLVALAHPGQDVRALHLALNGTAGEREDAIELLERLLEAPDRRRLLPLLEDLDARDRAALAGAPVPAGTLPDVLRTIASAPGTWLPVLAARAAASTDAKRAGGAAHA